MICSLRDEGEFLMMLKNSPSAQELLLTQLGPPGRRGAHNCFVPMDVGGSGCATGTGEKEEGEKKLKVGGESGITFKRLSELENFLHLLWAGSC